MIFGEIDPHHRLTIYQIIGVYAKNFKVTLLFEGFSRVFDSIHRGKIEQILLAYDLPKETVTAIMMLYQMETDFFDIAITLKET